MDQNEVIIRVGGAAGDGVQSAGLIIGKVFSRNGLHVQTYNYYQSIIRGGQSWYQIRASHNRVKSQGDGLDILIALNKDAIERHTNPKINEGGASPLDGIAVYDTALGDFTKYEKIKYCGLPLGEIAQKYSRNTLLKNTVAIGAVFGYLSLDFETLAGVIRDQFGGKGEIAELNVKAAKEGYDTFVTKYGKSSKALNPEEKRFYLISGGETAGMGAVRAGLKAYFGYPMTPASSIIHYLAAHSRKFDVFVKITEDEISAINMAIGANYAGIRAMTGSSGGGFALMTEAVGMAAEMEIPLVVYEAQRAGPSTGLPTKTEQGDLLQIIGASQGDFPKAVFSPRNVEEVYYMAGEALNLAEKYQMPVFLMVDLYLAEHYETVEKFDFTPDIVRPPFAKGDEKDYRRYAYTETGVSMRALPGTPNLMHNEDSDEHDEKGDVVSDAVTDPEIRRKIMEKRMKKLETYIKELPPTPSYLMEDAEYAVVQWGSTQGAVEEAVDILRSKGLKVGVIEVNRPFPVNQDIRDLVRGKKKVIFVENNYTGQLRRLISSEIGVTGDIITKYDGESFYPGALATQIEEKIRK
ncbi:MAG: 2-oxoacid:acceptor oxidoreductase subunit alpha [Candidatus Thermoplasmatota archaeon]|jgi:2-oxoglutarate ferredoxin oxidoreductase subunit alpha|nr:2-oxoacid:acceptor oxidoreductase subunit alpha [Candidatus Thermoplasmatota archaeon]MCL5790502.1 2-oxoacid:acceptor oxidoreductase subunit alpha [Candidatus Thermoplasmatota archaeon]